MISNFTKEELNSFFGLFHRLVNRNSGLESQVENLIFTLPDAMQEKIMNICDDAEYSQYLCEKTDYIESQKNPGSVIFPLMSIEDIGKVKHTFNWIVEPLFSKGSLSVIVGASGSLKTYAMLDAGLCVAAGKNWLGFPTKQTSVLYIDEESGDSRIAFRVKQIMLGEDIPNSIPFMASPLPRLNFTKDEDVQLLRDQIVKHAFGLVIIDAMIDVIGDADENSASSINPVMMQLSKLAKETKAAIILIHHTGKDNKYRGSTAIPGSVDLMMYLKKEQEKTLTFSIIKARDIDDDLKFTGRAYFSPMKDKFWIVGKGPNQLKKSEAPNAEAKIIQYLIKQPDSTIREIEKEISVYGYDYDYLRILVGKMEEKGLVENIYGGGKGKTGKFRLLI